MSKLQIISDKNKKSSSIKNLLLNKIKSNHFKKDNLIIVIGGDGFMLQTLKKYQKYNKPFYGINRGTYGFLMNKLKSFNLKKVILNSKLISISPLQIKIRTKNNKIFNSIAINEISLLRQSKQTASLRIIVGKKILIKKLVSDGVLISTPAGSTAYNMSVGGPILSLNSKKIAITSISPFRPRRWKGKTVPSTASIIIENLNIRKRSVSAVADNIEVRNIKSVNVKTNNQIKFKLMYDKKNSLVKKIKLEQIRHSL